MKTPQTHAQPDQAHSTTPAASHPSHAQGLSPATIAIAHSPRMAAQRQAMRAAFGSAAAVPQLQGDEAQQMVEEVAAPAGATERAATGEDAPNLTGMPNQLKSGIEAMSGIDMSAVRVHRNSDKPAQLSALAYAQGNDIHLGPGQERHLGHEAWHVVQQRQGRVKATMQMAGMGVNDDAGMEREADLMGGKAESGLVQLVGDGKKQDLTPNLTRLTARAPVAQRKLTTPTGEISSFMGLNSSQRGIFNRTVDLSMQDAVSKELFESETEYIVTLDTTLADVLKTVVAKLSPAIAPNAVSDVGPSSGERSATSTATPAAEEKKEEAPLTPTYPNIPAGGTQTTAIQQKWLRSAYPTAELTKHWHYGFEGWAMTNNLVGYSSSHGELGKGWVPHFNVTLPERGECHVYFNAAGNLELVGMGEKPSNFN